MFYKWISKGRTNELLSDYIRMIIHMNVFQLIITKNGNYHRKSLIHTFKNLSDYKFSLADIFTFFDMIIYLKYTATQLSFVCISHHL